MMKKTGNVYVPISSFTSLIKFHVNLLLPIFGVISTNNVSWCHINKSKNDLKSQKPRNLSKTFRWHFQVPEYIFHLICGVASMFLQKWWNLRIHQILLRATNSRYPKLSGCPTYEINSPIKKWLDIYAD